jgi:hypothetical protein
MSVKKLYHCVSGLRATFYSAFSSPSLGITWAIVTFLSGLLYLIYNERKRQIVEEAETDAAELESSDEGTGIEAHLT